MVNPTVMTDRMRLLNAKTAPPATFSSVRLTEKRFALEMDANVMALRAAPLTSLLVWMGQYVFPRLLCVMVTNTVMTAQMSWHHSATIAHRATFSSVRLMAKRFAAELH